MIATTSLAIAQRLGRIRFPAAFPSFFKEQLGVLVPVKRRCPVLLSELFKLLAQVGKVQSQRCSRLPGFDIAFTNSIHSPELSWLRG